jgi:hypothetical protein
MSDTIQPATESATPNYETDKKYMSLTKKVQQLFKKYKYVTTIEENYKILTTQFSDKHNASDTTRLYAADLLAHLKTNVYDLSIEQRMAEMKMKLSIDAAENVKAALEVVAQEDVYEKRIRSINIKRKAITDDYITKKKELEAEYGKTLKTLNDDDEINMVQRAQQELYVTIHKLGRYYRSLPENVVKREYARAVESQLGDTITTTKNRVQHILM